MIFCRGGEKSISQSLPGCGTYLHVEETSVQGNERENKNGSTLKQFYISIQTDIFTPSVIFSVTGISQAVNGQLQRSNIPESRTRAVAARAQPRV